MYIYIVYSSHAPKMNLVPLESKCAGSVNKCRNHKQQATNGLSLLKGLHLGLIKTKSADSSETHCPWDLFLFPFFHSKLSRSGIFVPFFDSNAKKKTWFWGPLTIDPRNQQQAMMWLVIIIMKSPAPTYPVAQSRSVSFWGWWLKPTPNRHIANVEDCKCIGMFTVCFSVRKLVNVPLTVATWPCWFERM